MNGTRGRTMIVATMLALPWWSCEGSRADAEPPARPGGRLEKVLAVVNQKPITELDLDLEMRSAAGHESGVSPSPAAVLESMIGQELAAAKAIELGLDSDPAYQAELGQLEAQVDAFKRKRLSELFYRKGLADAAGVSERDARAWFDANAQQIRTELHLFQILTRDRKKIDEAHRAIEGGASFEEVAASRFGDIPGAERKPWDLGFLRWNQMPEAWRDVVYALEPGQTSAVIAGPSGRFWVVKVVDRRDRGDVTFESERQAIIDQTQADRAARLREQTAKDLRSGAKVVYVKR